MSNYPENDWRNYLMHWGKGGEAKNHKYISRYKGKSGKWVYVYDKVAGAGKELKRQYNLVTSRNDIQNRMNRGYTTADLINLRDEGRVSWNGANPSNFGKENEYSKSRRLSTKVNNAVNKAKSNVSTTIAKKNPKLDVSIQKTKYTAERAAKTISGALQKLKNKRNLNKARKDIRSIKSDTSQVNGFPKLYNRLMAGERLTPQNKWMTDNKRRTRMTTRPSTVNKNKVNEIEVKPIEVKPIETRKIKNNRV